MTVNEQHNAEFYALTQADYAAAEAAGYIGDGPELEPEVEVEMTDEEETALADRLALPAQPVRVIVAINWGCAEARTDRFSSIEAAVAYHGEALNHGPSNSKALYYNDGDGWKYARGAAYSGWRDLDKIWNEMR